MKYDVYLNGAPRGPFSEERVQSFLDAGLLLPTDLASDHAQSDWKALAACARFHTGTTAVPLASSPPPPAPPPILPPPVALGPYARSTLSPNETPCYQTSLHWFIFARFGLAGVVLFICAAVPFAIAVQALTGSELGWFVLPLPAFLLVPPTVAFASSEIVLTDRRVLIKTGVIRRKTAEVFLSKVESITIEQGFLGRMFDFGTVRIRGTGGFEERFESIAHPLVFRNWVQRLQGGEGMAATMGGSVSRVPSTVRNS